MQDNWQLTEEEHYSLSSLTEFPQGYKISYSFAWSPISTFLFLKPIHGSVTAC